MKRVAVAFGSNLGDRLGNILAALRALSDANTVVSHLSRLYESTAAYVTDQPSFLNGAMLLETSLEPDHLLRRLKRVEAQLGRDPKGQRYGPRPIDLDIIFYEDATLRLGDTLEVPHPRWHERDFVRAPLADLPLSPASEAEHGRHRHGHAVPPHAHSRGTEAAAHAHAASGLDAALARAHQLWSDSGGEAAIRGSPDLQCVMPLGRHGLWRYGERAHVMGILNVTPDSFSDGGAHTSLPAALAHAKRMVAEGADLIDVGGQSTRPGARLLSPAEEAARVVPVIRVLSQDPATRDTPLSVDTFYAEVAAAAVEAGACMVNDVSGGTLDRAMLPQVAALGVPYVLMHMRGTPATMQLAEHTAYGDVVTDVAAELSAAGERAQRAGIEPWRLLLDPGLGFAKAPDASLRLLARLPDLRAALRRPLGSLPLLVGPSRKAFLGRITGREAPEERDAATAAAAALCVAEGACVVRVHNVAMARDAVLVGDAVHRARCAA